MNVPEQKGAKRLSAAALERLLADVAAGTEPKPELASLYAVLRAASEPGDPGAQPGESAALAAFGQIVPVRRMHRNPARWVAESRARLAAATGACLLVLGGGVAAAATGSLPGPAQGAVHDVLGAIGVHVPGSHGHSGAHGNGTSNTSPGHTGAHPSPRPSGSTGKPAHPVHPTYPVHPSHPSHPSHPAHPAHPVHPGHPAAHPTSHPAPHPSGPVVRPHLRVH